MPGGLRTGPVYFRFDVVSSKLSNPAAVVLMVMVEVVAVVRMMVCVFQLPGSVSV